MKQCFFNLHEPVMKAYNSSRHIHSREPRVVEAETIPISYDIHVLRLCSRIKAFDPTQSRISISLQLPPTTLHTQIAFRTRNTWGWYSSSDARFSNSRDSAETRYGEKKGESIFPQMGRASFCCRRLHLIRTFGSNRLPTRTFMHGKMWEGDEGERGGNVVLLMQTRQVEFL